MTQPIELDQVESLIRHYYGRLARTTLDKPSIHRARLQKTIQVLDHYLHLCTIIDSPIEFYQQ